MKFNFDVEDMSACACRIHGCVVMARGIAEEYSALAERARRLADDIAALEHMVPDEADEIADTLDAAWCDLDCIAECCDVARNGEVASSAWGFLENALEEMVETGMVRVCSECGKPMIDGYVVYDGEEYYCSDECLHKHFTEDEWGEMYESDCGYYTEWY